MMENECHVETPTWARWAIRLVLFALPAVLFVACDAPDDSAPPADEAENPTMPSDSGAAVRTYPDSVPAVWSRDLDERSMNSVAPSVDDGVAYVAAGRSVRAYDVDTGAEKWTHPLDISRSIGARNLVLDSARVYLAHFDQVVALRRNDGSAEWTRSVPDFTGVDLQVIASNATHLLIGGRGAAVRVEKATGSVDLRVPADSDANVLNPALLPDGRMLVPTYRRIPDQRATEGTLRLVSSTGDTIWQVDTEQRTYPTPQGGTYTAGGGVHGVTVTHGRSPKLAIYTTGQSVVARALESGEVIWRAFFQNYGFGTGPAVSTGSGTPTVVVGSTTGRLFGIDAETGETRWTLDVQGGMLVPTRFDRNGIAYQIDDGYGVLYAVDVDTGEVLRTGRPPENARDADATYRTAPGIGAERIAVVGSKRVYALRAVTRSE
jgi:outer membrane protein assembly factor BamB